MILIVGLGNPGPKYAKNRHNIGFMALDAIARRWNAGPWRQKFQGEVADVVIDGHKALLLKPLTFMNESGRAVGDAMRFHRIELKDIIVFHDELDLAPAKLREKTGGGNAGHNGLRSITQHCQNDYVRVRMGIGHPGHKDRVHAYVLNDFAKAEETWVDDLCRACADFAPSLAAGDGQRFQSDVAAEMQRRSWGDVPVVGGAGSA
ncbi:MAG: aminoacyl-tRNA hydrolase [Beijerinckiaceae bacterium]